MGKSVNCVIARDCMYNLKRWNILSTVLLIWKSEHKWELVKKGDSFGKSNLLTISYRKINLNQFCKKIFCRVVNEKVLWLDKQHVKNIG